MADPRRQQSASRGQLQELRDEQKVVREGFEFLEQKRMLIAAEIMRALRRHQAIDEEFSVGHADAVTALGRAIGFHGLGGVQVYPPRPYEDGSLSFDERRFLDLRLIDAATEGESVDRSRPAVLPSIEAELCAEAFRALIDGAARMAAIATSIARLLEDYRKTERRARALENVILPEIDETVKDFEDQLEAMDQEDAIRVRMRRS
ncbi:V-type ATP synthase subunit D [Lentisalinibacter sediminis]|uniref:V-type ATP synthase subunit D n=1 Tax=Lentisalinibacter sediminis TaxID=2992237 RepID=UPI00386FB718